MIDIAHLRGWIGREEETQDVAAPGPLRRLTALLDATVVDPQYVPPLGHWLFFLPDTPQRALGSDGHAAKGGFLPPVPLPRRMWAGGRLTFHSQIPVGSTLVRHSHITSVEHKLGSTGDIVFVTIHHRISADGTLCLEEEQDLVYRSIPPAATLAPLAHTEPRGGEVLAWRVPDPVLLFRYSALTFNAHRIHYDREYCREVEGYPGLVVHGPLIATLMMDAFQRAAPGARLDRFRFRAISALYDHETLAVAGAIDAGTATLTAGLSGDRDCMSAEFAFQRD
jgi:3-methylfumaryl-CoA hydratase